MNKTVSLRAIKWDIKSISRKGINIASRTLVGIGVAAYFIFSWTNFIPIENLVIVGLLVSIVSRIRKYWILKKREKDGRVIFFEKKSNGRSKNLYSFFIFLFFAFVSMNSGFWLIFHSLLSLIFFVRYVCYIPSIVFYADDYELIIQKGMKRKAIDFSYPNGLRFVYNMISFEHPINGKVVWKDVKLNREKINKLKYFLSDNYGNEMVISPSTGLPLVK